MNTRTKIILRVLGCALALFLLAPPAAQAAVHYLSTTRTVSGYGYVNCPAGTRVTGGGTGPLPADYYSSFGSDAYKLASSYPSGNGWVARMTRTHGTYFTNTGWRYNSVSEMARVYAICAS